MSTGQVLVKGKGSLRTWAADAKKEKAAGFWSTGSPEHPLRHELGHNVGATVENNYPDRFKAIEHLKASLDEERAAEYLGKYGFTNTREFIAESVAEYLNGNPRDTARQVVGLMLGD
jgi:hypothetical protein